MAKGVALVTGASSGIGLELSRLLAADGYDLILAARSEDRLRQLADELGAAHGVAVHTIALDLARPDASATLWHAVCAITSGVDVLVNDAGFGDTGAFAVEDPQLIERMLQLNIATLTALTRYALPGMLQRRCGHILNVSSLAGLQPGGPGMAVYYASKRYVLTFSRGIRRELRGSGVSVTTLCPGATDTGFEATARAQHTWLFHWVRPMSAAEVARAAYRGMRHGKAVVVPGWRNKVMALVWMLPDVLGLEINRLLLSPRR